MGPGCAGGGGPEYQRRNEGAAFKPVLIAGDPVRSGVDEMSLATKIAAGLCICPVVAAPPALVHKPTRDKIARAAGYGLKAQKPVRAPVSVNPEAACVEPSPSAPSIAMGDLARAGPPNTAQLPMNRTEEHTDEIS